jgi:UPF0716 family protein affecting phage T7 exclusion
MSLVKWTFIGLLVLPAAEIVGFLLVAAWIGWLWAGILFVATSVIGVMALKRSGRRDLARLADALRTEGILALHIDAPGLATMLGAILLIIPGFITDVLGGALFVPALRRWMAVGLIVGATVLTTSVLLAKPGVVKTKTGHTYYGDVNKADDGTVTVWDRSTGRPTFSFHGELLHPFLAWFSPDARRLAWTCLDGVIKIWDTTTGILEIDKPDNVWRCRAVTFSPDGKRIVYVRQFCDIMTDKRHSNLWIINADGSTAEM